MSVSAPFLENILEYRVMVPFELGVIARIIQHQHAKPAILMFHYLQAVSKFRRSQNGWVSASQEMTKGLGLDTMSRRRGLKALEELGLVELRQAERKAYWAKLLYTCQTGKSTAPRAKKPSQQHKSELEAEPDKINRETLKALSMVE